MQFANYLKTYDFDKKFLLIAPYVTKSTQLFNTQCLKKVEYKKIGLYDYIQVEYSPNSTKQYSWLMLSLHKEDNVFNIYYSEKTITVLFKVPSNCEAVARMIANSSITDLANGIILDNIKFWKESVFLLFE